MKKAFKRAAIGLTLALTFLGAVEWNGYHLFDRKDGTNVISETLKDSRQLTPGEIDLARGVFGNSIDYSKVRVFNRAWMGVFGNSGDMITPNGNIYVAGDKARSSDFSQQDQAGQMMFIHEMTHVWQFQHGRNVRGNAVKGWISSGFNYQSTYSYKLDEVKDFTKLGIEQQAHMVEDYFSALQDLRGFGCEESTTNRQFMCSIPAERMKDLASRIQPSIPLPGMPNARNFMPAPPPPPTLD
jgi:hypothetical protein